MSQTPASVASDEMPGSKGGMAGMNPELSIVVPFLNEEESLPLLRKRIEELEGLPERWEIILVSDGSTDRSVEIVGKWAEENPKVKLIILTRNFGHQAAISAGIHYTTGDYVGIIDADLQDEPETLMEMYRLVHNEAGTDIVYAVRTKRKGNPLKRALYRIFYKCYSFLAESPVHVNSGDFSVMSRRAIRLLQNMPERIRFMRGLRSWLGLKELPFEVERPERQAGRNQYSWAKLFQLAINGLTSFSTKPLRLATVAGIVLCMGAFATALRYFFLAVVRDVHGEAPGFTTIVVLTLFLHGVQLLLLGVLGEYMALVFLEVKRRPAYVVDTTTNIDESEVPATKSEA